MKKPEVSQKMYEEWDKLREKQDRYDAEYKEWSKRIKNNKTNTFSLQMLPPQDPSALYKNAAPLLHELQYSLPKAMSGRNRKKDEELVLVPRAILKFLIERASMGMRFD